MNDSWFILRTDLGNPAWNMAVDEVLFESAADLGRPVLRFYGWSEPAATFGYSQRYAEVEQWTLLRPLVRRITGGGLVPHAADWTYSVVFPPNHSWCQLRADESYRRLHEWVAAAFSAGQISAKLSPCCAKDLPGQCFAGAEKFDVLLDGRKIAGAAQKRNKFGLLIQGSVQPGESSMARADWEEAMRRSRGVEWSDWSLTDSLLQRANLLAEQKYMTSGHNQRR